MKNIMMVNAVHDNNPHSMGVLRPNWDTRESLGAWLLRGYGQTDCAAVPNDIVCLKNVCVVRTTDVAEIAAGCTHVVCGEYVSMKHVEKFPLLDFVRLIDGKWFLGGDVSNEFGATKINFIIALPNGQVLGGVL